MKNIGYRSKSEEKKYKNKKKTYEKPKLSVYKTSMEFAITCNVESNVSSQCTG